LYGNGAAVVGSAVLGGTALATTGFPAVGLTFLALVLVIGGLLLLRTGMVRRGS